MISIVMPTYNAAKNLPALLPILREQTAQHELIIIDSESTDDTRKIVESENIKLIQIRKDSFNHGTTRNIGLKVASSEIVVFMTQDALPASTSSLETLVSALSSREDIVMAYGRQLPYPETGVFGRLARLTNYPDHSLIKTRELIPQLGIKTCSCSNSFAAYSKSNLEAIGGFPADTVLGEDVSVAARFILQGKAVAYVAEAEVYHSHDYTLSEEFKRYFDIGAFHESQRKVLHEFSSAESEGYKYVLQEWRYLVNEGLIRLIPAQVVRTAAKYLGYKLGIWHQYLPVKLKSKLSMHSSFWLKDTLPVT